MMDCWKTLIKGSMWYELYQFFFPHNLVTIVSFFFECSHLSFSHTHMNNMLVRLIKKNQKVYECCMLSRMLVFVLLKNKESPSLDGTKSLYISLYQYGIYNEHPQWSSRGSGY
jgi:hypothetical protein